MSPCTCYELVLYCNRVEEIVEKSDLYDLYIQDKLKYKVIALTLSEHIDQALDLIEKSGNDKLSKAQLFAHVAQVLADKGDHGQAKIAMKDSLRLLHEIDDIKEYRIVYAVETAIDALVKLGDKNEIYGNLFRLTTKVIDNDGSRSKAIAAVVKGLSRMGEIDKALELTSAIADNRSKPEAQISIVRAYAVKRSFGQALATSDSLVELYSPLALNALLYTSSF